jgi:hypothetical protein
VAEKKVTPKAPAGSDKTSKDAAARVTKKKAARMTRKKVLKKL